MPTTRLRPGDIRNTTTFRLTAMFGVVLIVAMMTLLGLVYVQTARELTSRSDRILQSEAVRLLQVPAEQLPAQIASRLAGNGQGLSFYALYAGTGERLLGNIIMPQGLKLNVPTDDWVGFSNRHPRRLLAARTRWGETIVVGRDISQIRDLRLTILRILFWSGMLTAIGGLVLGTLLSLRPIRRVQELQAASNRISRGDFDVRMPISGSNDELDRFAGTVNGMIDEVVRSLGQVRSVTDAIAHDLRTPLSRVRTLLDRARQPGASGKDFEKIAARAITDLDIVLDRFGALLRISELETGHKRSGFHPVALAGLIEQAIELYTPLAEEREQTLRFTTASPLSVVGDGELLFEAVANLIDNAIKFTPVSGNIEVSLTRGSRGPVIEVRDTGPGLRLEERGAVLQRFYRGSGAGAVPGTGLGLSIVAAICHLHRFTLTLDEGCPGLIARLACFDAGAADAADIN